jgi:hypothetical protein
MSSDCPAAAQRAPICSAVARRYGPEPTQACAFAESIHASPLAADEALFLQLRIAIEPVRTNADPIRGMQVE